MRWSAKPHELPDGTPVDGVAAAVARSLDDYDPLAHDERNVLTESQTRAEIMHFLDEFRWCRSLDIGVCRGTRDTWRTVSDDELYGLVTTFLYARVVWATAALAATPPDDADARAQASRYLKFVTKGDTSKSARSMSNDAKALMGVDVSDLDRNPYLLGTPNGTLSIDTGLLIPDSEEQTAFLNGVPVTYSNLRHMVTKSTIAEADSAFTGRTFTIEPRWEEFVDEICDGDAEKAAFLQRALGYSLLGGNPEKATFVLWGPTRDNGKSTLMNAVKLALGDYADTAPAGLLLVNRNENYTAANPVLAKLVGKRLVDVSEPPAGAELNGAMVKKLASGTDPVSCRQLHGKEFTYVPDFTLWMHCNALPVVRDPSAIDPRHMFVIEFTRSFGPDERDHELWETITSEDGLHTILEWLVSGYLDYEERGSLEPPRCVTAATEAWLSVSGTWLDRFVEDMLVRNASERVDVDTLKSLMRAWLDAEDRTDEMMPMQSVNKYLEAAGIYRKRPHGKTTYIGIALSDGGRRLLEESTEGAEVSHRHDSGKARIKLS